MTRCEHLETRPVIRIGASLGPVPCNVRAEVKVTNLASGRTLHLCTEHASSSFSGEPTKERR